MKYLKIGIGVFFIMIGILFFVFLRMLNDPEVEGNSGRIRLSEYFISFIPIAIGLIILFFKNYKKSI
jgi:cadmium resistance protein CadD (predicted permease)